MVAIFFFPGAAVTHYQKLCILNDEHLISPFLGATKSKCQWDYAPSEGYWEKFLLISSSFWSLLETFGVPWFMEA